MRRTPLLVLVLCFVLAFPAVAGPMTPNLQGDPGAVAAVKAAWDKLAAAKSYRGTMRGAGMPGAGTIEFVAPNRNRMTTSQGGQRMEIIIIGQEMWMKTGGQCAKQPMNPSAMLSGRLDAPRGTWKVSAASTQTIGGVPTRVYLMEMVQGAPGAPQGKTTLKLYIATSTGLPRRVENIMKEGTFTYDIEAYGVPITITPPC